MSATEELLASLQASTAETPFAVERTDDGLDVRTDIVDARWASIAYAQGLKKVYTHHVAVDDDARTYTITDDSYEVSWKAGVDTDGGVPTPVLRKSAQRQLGTVKEFSTRKTYAFDEQGEFGKVVDYTFNSEDGRRLVREHAERLGLSEKRGTITMIGIAVALAAVVLAVVVLVLLLALG